MAEEPKTNEESWSVEPPKQESKKRKALRVALIVAALGVVAAGVFAAGAVLYYGDEIRAMRDAFEKREPLGGDIVYEPKERAEKSQMGNRISEGAEQQ